MALIRLESDVLTLKPDVNHQDVVGGKAGGPVFVDTLPGIPLRLTTWAANIVIRSPSLSDVLSLMAAWDTPSFLPI
jgi:hypothetical protein